MNKLTGWFFRIINKRVAKQAGIDPTETTEESMDKPWYKSKGKIGAIIAGLAFIVQTTLPAFGIDITIPVWVYSLLQGFGISLSAYGIRDAINK